MKWSFTALVLVSPVAALAQSGPIPLAPEAWATTVDQLCRSHACYHDGSVRFAVTVSPAGRVTDCEILESSGNALLDEASCRFLARRARFKPARDQKGHTVEGRWESRLTWKTPDALPASGSENAPR